MGARAQGLLRGTATYTEGRRRAGASGLRVRDRRPAAEGCGARRIASADDAAPVEGDGAAGPPGVSRGGRGGAFRAGAPPAGRAASPRDRVSARSAQGGPGLSQKGLLAGSRRGGPPAASPARAALARVGRQVRFVVTPKLAVRAEGYAA